MTGSPVADRIFEELGVAPDGLTKTEIRDLFDRNQKASVINDALSMLEALGYVAVEKENTGERGRPVERVKIIGAYDMAQ